MVARSAWAHLGPWPSACRKAGSSLTNTVRVPGQVWGLGCSLLGPGHVGEPCVALSSSGAGRPADDGESLGEAAWLHVTPPRDPGQVPKPLCTLGEQQMCWLASQVEPHNPEPPPQPQFPIVAKRLHLWEQPQVLVSGSLTSWVQ